MDRGHTCLIGERGHEKLASHRQHRAKFEKKTPSADCPNSKDLLRRPAGKAPTRLDACPSSGARTAPECTPDTR